MVQEKKMELKKNQCGGHKEVNMKQEKAKKIEITN